MTDYRAGFDAEVTFLNGGGLQAQGFRLDIWGPDVSESELAAGFVGQLGLLMTGQVRLSAVRILQEPHKGLGGRSAPAATGSGRRGIGVGALAALDVSGCAVVLHTGWDRFFGTPPTATPHPI